jgi:4-aminobutyrate aminotransferase-like enzyme
MQKGVYSIRTGCGTIKLGPPLTISEDALKEAIQVYKESMNELIIAV